MNVPAVVHDTGHQKQSDPALKQLSVVAKAKSSISQNDIVGFGCESPFKGHGFRQSLLKVERWAPTDSRNQTAPTHPERRCPTPLQTASLNPAGSNLSCHSKFRQRNI